MPIHPSRNLLTQRLCQLSGRCPSFAQLLDRKPILSPAKRHVGTLAMMMSEKPPVGLYGSSIPTGQGVQLHDDAEKKRRSKWSGGRC
jgi:hypothetical protein